MTAQLNPAFYTADVAGQQVQLPLVAVSDQTAIALMMTIDMGVRFGEHVGRELANRLRPLAPEVILGTATLGIPVAIEVSRALGLDRYVIVQKSPKKHLADALVHTVRSITSHGEQRLLLDRRAVSLLAGRRVAVVDDVVATGASLLGAMALARDAGAQVVACGVVLTDGWEWQAAMGADAGLVVSLGHIPQFRIHPDGRATVIPETA